MQMWKEFWSQESVFFFWAFQNLEGAEGATVERSTCVPLLIQYVVTSGNKKSAVSLQLRKSSYCLLQERSISVKWKCRKVWLFNSIHINHYVLQLQVVLQKCKVKSLMHSPGDYILLSADKYEIKVCTTYHTSIISVPSEAKCLKFANRCYFIPYSLL